MKISEEVGSKYRFIVLAGQRVAQLQKGAKPRIEQYDKKKLTQIAVEEIEEELIKFNKIDLDAVGRETNETEDAKSESAAT